MKYLIIVLFIIKISYSIDDFCPFETWHNITYAAPPILLMVGTNEVLYKCGVNSKNSRLFLSLLSGIVMVVGQSIYYKDYKLQTVFGHIGVVSGFGLLLRFQL